MMANFEVIFCFNSTKALTIFLLTTCIAKVSKSSCLLHSCRACI